MLEGKEIKVTKKAIKDTALTYAVSLVTSLIQIFRLVLISHNRD